MPSTSPAPGSTPAGFQVDDLTIDIGRRSVLRGGAEIALPGLSFDLLVALTRAAPNMLSHDELLARVWNGAIVSSETISQRVKLVRDALGDDPQTPRYIAGVRGRGYRLLPEPVPLTAARPDNPPEAAAAAAPVSAFSRRRMAAMVVTGGIGVVAVAVLSWHAWHNSRGTAGGSSLAPAEVIVSAPKTIAVLPFVDLSEDHSQEFFADGMAEELLGVLAQIPQLTVIGRASSFSFKGGKDDVRVIGEKLGAAYLVEGSVRRSDRHIRVSAQLLDARSGTQLWSSTYDRDFGDVLMLQDEMASSIARALQLAVGADAPRDTYPLRNAEAYTFYLRGRAALDRGEANVTEAKTYFEQALTFEPDFGRAREALALAHLEEVEAGAIAPRVGWPRAVDATNEALRRNPTFALAHVTRGLERAEYAFDWSGANAELNQVVALRPHDPYALYMGSWLAVDLGQYETATALADAALAIDPLNPEAHQARGDVHYYLGDLDGAEREYRACLQISPTFSFVHRELGLIELRRQHPREALAEMELEGSSVGLALAYYALGRKRESDEQLARWKGEAEKSAGFTFVSAARVHTFRNEPDAALLMLEKAFERRDHNLVAITYDPLFNPLRNDPRFQAILREMNLPGTPPTGKASEFVVTAAPRSR